MDDQGIAFWGMTVTPSRSSDVSGDAGTSVDAHAPSRPDQVIRYSESKRIATLPENTGQTNLIQNLWFARYIGDMAAVMEPLGLSPVHGVKRRVVGRRSAMHTQIPELVFTKSKGPIDFIPSGSKNNDNATRRTRKLRQRRNQQSTNANVPHVTEVSDKDNVTQDAFSSEIVHVAVPATIPNSTLLEHIATSRFFHQYVSPTRTFCRLDLDFTSFVIDNAAMRSTLAEVVIALGILTLPRKTDASCMAARLRYARALRLTNGALRDNTEAKSDEVLMAVILLSFFETTPHDEHSMASWTAHLDGARMLFRIRGRELLQRGPTYRMFSMLRTQMLINSLMTMQPVHQDLIDLSAQISETQDEEEKAASQLVNLFARMCNLFASSRDAAHINRQDVLAQAIALDTDLVSWSLTLPSSYEYFTEPASPSANTYAGYCEVYSSLFSAEVWNLYRSARLGVNGIIVEQQAMLSMEQEQPASRSETVGTSLETGSEATDTLNIRFSILESLRNDICAATPFMLGRDGENANRSVNDIPLCRRTPVVHHLLFLLKTAGITQEMSGWAMSQINELQSEKEVDSGAVWTHSSMNYTE